MHGMTRTPYKTEQFLFNIDFLSEALKRVDLFVERVPTWIEAW